MYEYVVTFINDDGIDDEVYFYTLGDAEGFCLGLSLDANGELFRLVYHSRGVDRVAVK